MQAIKPSDDVAESTLSLGGTSDHSWHVEQCNACPCTGHRELVFLSGFVEIRKTGGSAVISERKALDWWVHLGGI